MNLKEHTMTRQEKIYSIGILLLSLLYFWIDQPIP